MVKLQVFECQKSYNIFYSCAGTLNSSTTWAQAIQVATHRNASSLALLTFHDALCTFFNFNRITRFEKGTKMTAQAVQWLEINNNCFIEFPYRVNKKFAYSRFQGVTKNANSLLILCQTKEGEIQELLIYITGYLIAQVKK